MVKKRREWVRNMAGGQLMSAGEIIQVMDNGGPVKCLVLSCLAADDGACYASLEILEGERKGERMRAKLRAGEKMSE